MATKYTYTMCFGIVKTKPTAKQSVWTVNAKDYESAIRQCKKYAQSNYESYTHPATLFYEGHVVGWVYKDGNQMIYIDKDLMQRLGLMSRPRK